MRARKIAILIALLAISAISIILIIPLRGGLQPHIYLKPQSGTFIQFTTQEETPMGLKVDSLSIRTNGLKTSQILYQKVTVLNVWTNSTHPIR